MAVKFEFFSSIDQIKDTIQDLKKEQAVMREESKAIRAKGKSSVNKTFASIHRTDFDFARQKPSQCDIRMADVYDKIPFDNPDGGKYLLSCHFDQENLRRIFI